MLDLQLTGREFKSWPPAVECNPGKVVRTRASVTKQPIGGDCLVAGKVTVGLCDRH